MWVYRGVVLMSMKEFLEHYHIIRGPVNTHNFSGPSEILMLHLQVYTYVQPGEYPTKNEIKKNIIEGIHQFADAMEHRLDNEDL
jgi:hypothetical protein